MRTYRIRYWIPVGDSGYWQLTGLMTKENAETIAEGLRKTHANVEVYLDDNE